MTLLHQSRDPVFYCRCLFYVTRGYSRVPSSLPWSVGWVSLLVEVGVLLIEGILVRWLSKPSKIKLGVARSCSTRVVAMSWRRARSPVAVNKWLGKRCGSNRWSIAECEWPAGRREIGTSTSMLFCCTITNKTFTSIFLSGTIVLGKGSGACKQNAGVVTGQWWLCLLHSKIPIGTLFIK